MAPGEVWEDIGGADSPRMPERAPARAPVRAPVCAPARGPMRAEETQRILALVAAREKEWMDTARAGAPVFAYKCRLVRPTTKLCTPHMLPDPVGPAAPHTSYTKVMRCNHDSCKPKKRKPRAAAPLQREWCDVGTGDLSDYITRDQRQWGGGNGRKDAVLRLCDGSYGCVVCGVSASRACRAKRKCRDWMAHMPTASDWGGEHMLHRDVTSFDATTRTCGACAGGDDQ